MLTDKNLVSSGESIHVNVTIADRGNVNETLVTFDDPLVGFTSPTNGSFNFTFDVPLAQPGVHLVKAIDFSSSIQASGILYVLSPVVPSGKLDISVNAGAIYFPGDTVVAYV